MNQSDSVILFCTFAGEDDVDEVEEAGELDTSTSFERSWSPVGVPLKTAILAKLLQHTA